MIVNRKQAMEIWESYFGREVCVIDPFGQQMCKANYGEDGGNSWNIDHIWPLHPSDENALEGANFLANVQPLAIESNKRKSNNLQGKVFGVTYAISKEYIQDGKAIGRMSIIKDGRWVWAYPLPLYYGK